MKRLHFEAAFSLFNDNFVESRRFLGKVLRYSECSFVRRCFGL